jgi:hypothetical protein
MAKIIKIFDDRRIIGLGFVALLTLAASTALKAQTVCNDEENTCAYSGDMVDRADSNDVEASLYDYVSGEYGFEYEVCLDATLLLNDSELASAYPCSDGGTIDEDLGDFTLPTSGPGPFDYVLGVSYSLSCYEECDDPDAPYGAYQGQEVDVSRPTITGPGGGTAVSAFWWLGSGVLSDVTAYAAYYAQAAWVANPNGASGTPSWSVDNYGTGQISLSCTSCTSTTATSLDYSLSCYADIAVTVNYGGFSSAPFWVTIVMPYTLTLDDIFDGVYLGGYNTATWWILSDTCGYNDFGLDYNEVFGAFTDDYFLATGMHNNWGVPSPWHDTASSSLYIDNIQAYPAIGGMPNPNMTGPQDPLSTIAVNHDAPWHLFFASPTFGTGLLLEDDTQQWYVDHGRHN